MPKYIDADKLAAELSAGGIPINEQGGKIYGMGRKNVKRNR